MATAAVARLPSSTECIGPPTIRTAEKRIIIRKNRRIGDGMKPSATPGRCHARRLPHRHSSSARRSRSVGGSAAACFSISSNGRSLYQTNEIRFAKRLTSLRISSAQYLSLGELPFTTATVFVSGNTRKIFSKTAGKLCATATTVSFGVRIGILNAPLFHRRKHHGSRRQRAAAGGAGQRRQRARRGSQSGRADVWHAGHGDTRANGASGFSSLERAAHERMLCDIQRPW